MAIMKVNATRVNLLFLKKRLKTAKRGHKLLKDKRDGLMQEFMGIIREARSLRQRIEGEMGEVFAQYLRASALMDPQALSAALSASTAQIDMQVSTKNVMSVRIPQFSAAFSGEAMNFLPTGTIAALENALSRLQELIQDLFLLSQLEKAAELLAAEIELTRRRVNMLEHRMIPDIKDTLRFISLKLDESARDALVSVMRIKSMIEAKEREQAELATA